MTGKKYSFATTILGANILNDEDEEYNQQVTYSLMHQLSVKVALREWGDEARSRKETLQLSIYQMHSSKRESKMQRTASSSA